ncbi:MAG: helix-turn-helix domain-containing protein [Victivallales bacterium]|nr:helix-turn-helix domain-containing protein [Victivallales bacterium]
MNFKVVLLDKDLTDFQIRVFFYLSMCGGRKGVCFPKQETIAIDLNSTRRGVAKAISKLCEKGLITVSKRGKLRNYTINDLECENHGSQMGQCENHGSRVCENHGSQQNVIKREIIKELHVGQKPNKGNYQSNPKKNNKRSAARLLELKEWDERCRKNAIYDIKRKMPDKHKDFLNLYHSLNNCKNRDLIIRRAQNLQRLGRNSSDWEPTKYGYINACKCLKRAINEANN